jgi:hypothetical protein
MRAGGTVSRIACSFSVAAACGGGAPPGAPGPSGFGAPPPGASDNAPVATSANAVIGTIAGAAFGPVARAYWIGNPGAGSLPTQIYITGAPLDCSSITAPLWDKTIGNAPLLELGVRGMRPSPYRIGVDADASYLPSGTSSFNPSADSGTVTIEDVHATMDVAGSFQLHFAADSLSGVFDAAYCAGGVEP